MVDVKHSEPTATDLLYRRLPPPIRGLFSANGPTHPAVTEGESVGPTGLPGPQLRLASIWPDRENTSQLKEQKQQRMDRGGPSNGDSNPDPNLTD